MDPLIPVLQGVVSNALWELLKRYPRQSTSSSRVLEKQEEHFRRRLRQSRIIEAFVEDLAGCGLLSTDDKRAAFEAFIGSPEAETLLRQATLFCTFRRWPAPERTSRAVEVLLTRELGEHAARTATPIVSSFLFEASARITRAFGGRDELLQVLDPRSLEAEESTIEHSLSILDADSQFSLSDSLSFENHLRKALERSSSHITPPHLGAIRRVPIEQIYVQPKITTTATAKGQQAADDFNRARQFYRVAVLGDPGAGKSTLARRLSYSMATSGPRLAFPVVLREYFSAGASQNQSFLEYLGTLSRTLYQLQVPSHALEFLLHTGRLALIFDGLDELSDLSLRENAVQSIEAFCQRYTTAPVLVTSREVGYDSAPLSRNFETFRIAPFDEGRVEEYVTKWFACDESLVGAKAAGMTRAFLQESKAFLDVRRNPLLLSLMCSIYRGDGYIPQNRPEVYEKCALMLFEKWDKSRGIETPVGFESHLRPILSHLAFWVLSDAKLQDGVSQTRLVSEAAEYWLGRRFDDADLARQEARTLIEYCSGRAWVFTDTGSEGGEALFQFTHRTFIEYFAAHYLCRSNPTPEGLASAIYPYVRDGQWEVVCQIAVQLRDRQVDDGGGVTIRTLLQMLDEDRSNPTQRLNVVDFAIQSMESVYPSLDSIQVTAEGMLHALASIRISARHKATASHVLAASAENRTKLLAALAAAVEKALSADAEAGVRCAEMALALPDLASGCFPGTGTFATTDPRWEKVVSGVLTVLRAGHVVMPENPGLAFLLLERGVVDPDAVLPADPHTFFGVGSPVLGRGAPLHQRMLKLVFLEKLTATQLVALERALEVIGARITGWQGKLEVASSRVRGILDYDAFRSTIGDDGAAFWSKASQQSFLGVFCLLACGVETMQGNVNKTFLSELLVRSGHPYASCIGEAIVHRLTRSPLAGLSESKFRVGREATQAVLAWANWDTSYLASPAHEQSVTS